MIAKVKIQDGTRTADIAEGISWSLVREIDADTWEISAPEYEAEQEKNALKAGVQLTTAERILDERLPKERISEFAKVFDEPETGRTYKKDWILRDPLTDYLYKVVQPQITWEAWWKFDEIAPTLIVRVLEEDEAKIWDVNIQVTADEVWNYQGKEYEVIQPHTTQLGWEPPNVPALWKPI
jgi:hypothetical protein